MEASCRKALFLARSKTGRLQIESSNGDSALKETTRSRKESGDRVNYFRIGCYLVKWRDWAARIIFFY